MRDSTSYGEVWLSQPQIVSSPSVRSRDHGGSGEPLPSLPSKFEAQLARKREIEAKIVSGSIIGADSREVPALTLIIDELARNIRVEPVRLGFASSVQILSSPSTCSSLEVFNEVTCDFHQSFAHERNIYCNGAELFSSLPLPVDDKIVIAYVFGSASLVFEFPGQALSFLAPTKSSCAFNKVNCENLMDFVLCGAVRSHFDDYVSFVLYDFETGCVLCNDIGLRLLLYDQHCLISLSILVRDGLGKSVFKFLNASEMNVNVYDMFADGYFCSSWLFESLFALLISNGFKVDQATVVEYSLLPDYILTERSICFELIIPIIHGPCISACESYVDFGYCRLVKMSNGNCGYVCTISMLPVNVSRVLWNGVEFRLLLYALVLRIVQPSEVLIGITCCRVVGSKLGFDKANSGLFLVLWTTCCAQLLNVIRNAVCPTLLCPRVRSGSRKRIDSVHMRVWVGFKLMLYARTLMCVRFSEVVSKFGLPDCLYWSDGSKTDYGDKDLKLHRVLGTGCLAIASSFNSKHCFEPAGGSPIVSNPKFKSTLLFVIVAKFCDQDHVAKSEFRYGFRLDKFEVRLLFLYTRVHRKMKSSYNDNLAIIVDRLARSDNFEPIRLGFLFLKILDTENIANLEQLREFFLVGYSVKGVNLKCKPYVEPPNLIDKLERTGVNMCGKCNFDKVRLIYSVNSSEPDPNFGSKLGFDYPARDSLLVLNYTFDLLICHGICYYLCLPVEIGLILLLYDLYCDMESSIRCCILLACGAMVLDNLSWINFIKFLAVCSLRPTSLKSKLYGSHIANLIGQYAYLCVRHENVKLLVVVCAKNKNK